MKVQFLRGYGGKRTGEVHYQQGDVVDLAEEVGKYLTETVDPPVALIVPQETPVKIAPPAEEKRLSGMMTTMSEGVAPRRGRR